MKAMIIGKPAETSILEVEDEEVEDIAVVLPEEIVLFFLLDSKKHGKGKNIRNWKSKSMNL